MSLARHLWCCTVSAHCNWSRGAAPAIYIKRATAVVARHISSESDLPAMNFTTAAAAAAPAADALLLATPLQEAISACQWQPELTPARIYVTALQPLATAHLP
jgi:hypothetical protein